MNAKTMAVKSVLRVLGLNTEKVCGCGLNLNWNVPRINFSESAVEIVKLDRTRFGSIGGILAARRLAGFVPPDGAIDRRCLNLAECRLLATPGRFLNLWGTAAL